MQHARTATRRSAITSVTDSSGSFWYLRVTRCEHSYASRNDNTSLGVTSCASQRRFTSFSS